MNIATVRTAVLDGLRPRPGEVRVERRSDAGPFQLEISGLGTTATETTVRVQTGLRQSGIKLPSGRFSVAATPATERNTALHDLPVALGVLTAAGRIDPARLTGTLAVGSIDTRGTLTPVRGMFPIAGLCAQLGRRLIGPGAQRAEAACAGPVEVLLRHDLGTLVRAICNGERTETLRPGDAGHGREPERQEPIPGYLDAKRALEIAVAGDHPLLVASHHLAPIGPLARRAARWAGPLPTDAWGMLTTARSIAGLLAPDETGTRERPFRAPHYTASRISITGKANGGSDGRNGEIPAPASPGEATLAHGGILYLEQLDEFRRDTLEPLRAAARTRTIADRTGTMPADMLLIGNMIAAAEDTTTVLATRLKRHPLHDTLQAAIAVPYEPYATRQDSRTTGEEEEEHWRRMRIQVARDAQHRRYGGTTTNGRADLKTLLTKGRHTPDAQMRIEQLQSALGTRRTTNVVRLGRTIADLRGNPETRGADIEEAEALAHHAT